MTFEEARAQYPVLERLAYLNAGTNGPLSRAAAEAMVEATQRGLADGRGDRSYIETWLSLRDEVRERLARLISVPPENVALLNSTTAGCNVVVSGLDLAPEDEVVTTDSEHFGLIGPLHASRARVVVSPPDEDEILARVTARTRLLAVSHVLWTNGRRLDLRRLKADTGLPLLVDGAQSAGAVPVDAAESDFYTVSAQKWLCGPEATGALYVADPEGLRVAAPTYMAQERHDPDGSFVPWPGAARFDSAQISPVALAGLRGALGVHPEWRYERAAEAARRCRELLSERFEVEPGDATLVAFRPEGEPVEMVARLRERDVVVRDIPGRGIIRVSCGYWTSDADLDRLLDALR